MIQLTAFSPADFDRFISWIDSEGLLMTIAGTVFSYPLTVAQLETYLADKNSYAFNIVDVNEDRIIGHAELIMQEQNTCKIDKLIIGDQSNRGKGRGQEVIRKLLEYSFANLGAKTVELNVFDWNTAGIRCYEKCGFKMNPAKQALFRSGSETWTALNMTIDMVNWNGAK
jgi:RimJ/RimL family protein N-acetyltransferase